MREYELLDWDTEFFGFGVARVIPAALTARQLKAVLKVLKRKKVSLVYWASSTGSNESEAAGYVAGGQLVDKKTTYLMNIQALSISSVEYSNKVQEYREQSASAELENMAISSGAFSRFRVDARITTERYEELYRVWIQKSVTKEIADVVLVAYDGNDKVCGMITLGEKNGRGDIGLVAVDALYRGQGYGRFLLSAALQYFRSKGYTHSQVVTQGDNKPACKLYESAGYQVETCENIFHFWLI